jgi:hypothetical protein
MGECVWQITEARFKTLMREHENKLFLTKGEQEVKQPQGTTIFPFMIFQFTINVSKRDGEHTYGPSKIRPKFGQNSEDEKGRATEKVVRCA